jgi:5-(carboxyamino)imidazole ribonucleotide synthase
LGLPVPRFFALDEVEHLQSKIEYLGFPAVLKARRHGYDGQGTFIIQDFDTLEQKLSYETITKPLNESFFLLEEFVPFERELAIIAARSVEGEIVTYPVVETQQEQQVCRRVIAPADITPNQVAEIQAIAHTLLNSLEVVGIFGIELFLRHDGKVLVNEIAPRTHNSGHFSIDACETSQFEQHLRAVCGLPLGNPALQCAGAVMVNLLGYENSHSDYQSQRQQIAEIPQAHVHWYGKTESRPGRKLGHVTVLLDNQNRESASAIAHTIESIWYPR